MGPQSAPALPALSTTPIRSHSVCLRLARSLRRKQNQAAASRKVACSLEPADVWRRALPKHGVQQNWAAKRDHRQAHVCRASEGGHQPHYNLVRNASSLREQCLSPRWTAVGEQSTDSRGRLLLLGTLFAGWYLFNIWFNVYNKQSLTAYPFPFTITTLQFALGGAFSLIMWTFGLLKRPEVDGNLIKGVLPLAMVHTLGNLLTNISLGKVAVSFTHTIKAMEPFFSVLLSTLFLNDRPTPLIMLSLFPIVAGVGLASVSEVTFNWPGFGAAMGSNVTFQSRNVFSKKLMAGSGLKSKLGNINLFSLITVMSFFLLAPITLLVEGVRFTPQAMQQFSAVPVERLVKQAVIAAACFHSYQQVSYMILARVTPVTHSIGNCLKRVIVIVASVIFFQNPMSRQNIIGTAIALGGVFLYSQAKRTPAGKIKAA